MERAARPCSHYAGAQRRGAQRRGAQLRASAAMPGPTPPARESESCGAAGTGPYTEPESRFYGMLIILMIIMIMVIMVIMIMI